MDELGRVLTRQKRAAEAVNYFKEGLRLQPESARLHLRLAEPLGALGRRDEAMLSLHKAIELRLDYWEARYYLGVELGLRDHIKEAAEQFSEVVRLQPAYTLAHLNLGVALTRQNRLQE